MLNFWVRRDGQEDWQPVPAEGAVLEEDTYTIVARSPQPHFTITVEVRQRPLGPQNQGPNTGTTPPQVQTRSVRTNDEGIGIILPASRLTPGFWELHCRDADLIAELFGETELDNCLRFQVVPAPAPLEPERGIPAPVAEEAGFEPPQKKEVAIPPELFSLMHSELEGSPEEVLVLTGRIGCSGELRVQVWPEGEERPLFQGQRQIQLPAGARTAVFSIPITLPSQVWARPLRGELALTPSSWWDPEPSPQTLTIPFSIRCRSQEAGLLGAGIPLPQQQEEERLADAASPASTATLLSPERTLQKLLRIWQHSAPAGGDPGSTQPAEPSAKAAPEPNPQPAAPISPLPSPPQAEPMGEDAALPAPAGSPATPPPPAFALPATSKDTKNSPPPPEVCPAPQLLVPEQLRAGDNFDVVLRLPALAPASAAGAASQPPYWIKFWVKHGRTRSLVDGPRWLLDFSRDDQGQWQALTRMTIPPGVPELIFEAWAVSPDRQQQSDRVTEHRSILP
ncbi:hypothetical protein [Thermostichus sp. MS-CIW-30]|jgi:hypothetical protein